MPSNRSGCATRLPQFLIIMIVALLLAGALFWAVPYLKGRPLLRRGVTERMIEGNLIRISMDPEKEVYLLPLAGIGGESLLTMATATPAILPTVMATATTQPLPTAAPPTVTPIPRTGCVVFTDYTVQAGDTLYSISRRFVTSITLMARHGISSTSLVPGAVISVPVGDPSCCAGGWRPYVVEEGETWSGIAFSNGVSTEILLQTNGQPVGATLYLASVICVP